MIGAVILTVIALLNFSAILIYSLSAFGNGIVYQIGWQACYRLGGPCDGEVSTGVLHVSIAGLLTFPLLLLLSKKHVDWKLAIHLAVTQQVGNFVGVYILFSFSSPWVARALGLVMFISALMRAQAEFEVRQQQHQQQQQQSHQPQPQEELEKGKTQQELQGQTDEQGTGKQETKLPENTSVTVPVELGPAMCDRVDDALIVECGVPYTNGGNDMSNQSEGGRRGEYSDNVSTAATTAVKCNTSTIVASVKQYDFHVRQDYFRVWFFGVASGLFSGLFGASGPPMMYFVSSINLDKTVCRATITFLHCIQTYMRVIFIYINSPSSFGLTSTSFWLLVAILNFSSLVGLTVGNSLFKYVNQHHFRYIILILLVVGSLLLATAKASLTAMLIIIAAGVVVYTIIGTLLWWRVNNRSRNSRRSRRGSSSINREQQQQQPQTEIGADTTSIVSSADGGEGGGGSGSGSDSGNRGNCNYNSGGDGHGHGHGNGDCYIPVGTSCASSDTAEEE